MPLIQPDFSEVITLTPGEYKVRIINSEIKTSKAGNPYVEWTLETFSCEDSRLNGRTLKHRTMCTGAGAGMLKKFVTSVTTEELPQAFDTEMLHGRELIVVLVEGKDQQGRPTEWPEVKAVKRLA